MEAIKETREERKARIKEAEETQYELDMEQINDLELTHGDSNIAVVRVPYTEGLPVCIAVRTPKPNEIKRWRAMYKGKSTEADTQALEDLARVCCVYPDKNTLLQVLEARPAMLINMADAAVSLSTSSRALEGKG
jgi:hypothetical protein